MHRRLFLGGGLGLAGASAAGAAIPPLTSGASVVEAYARRLQAGLDRTGGGRFLFDDEAELHAAHQTIRADAGLPPLEFHRGLALTARAHAADQSLGGFFGHESPDGFGPADRVGLMARTFLGLPGENIIDHSGGWMGVVPRALMASWMDSPGHKANILRRRFTHLGLGAVQTGRRTVAVAVFGERFAELAAPIPLSPEPGEIALALQHAEPAIYSYDLSRVGRDEREGVFSAGQSPSRLAAGPYTLRPRLQDGNRFTIVVGPIVELAG